MILVKDKLNLIHSKKLTAFSKTSVFSLDKKTFS